MGKYVRFLFLTIMTGFISGAALYSYFTVERSPMVLTVGLVYLWVVVVTLSDFEAVRKVDDTGRSPIVAKMLRSHRPDVKLRNIYAKRGIKNVALTAYEGVKIDPTSAQSAVLLMQRVRGEEYGFILALCIAEIQYLYKGWMRAAERCANAEEEVKRTKDALQQMRKAHAEKLKQLGMQTSAIDALKAEVNSLKHDKPPADKPPAPINFDHENAVLERKLIKLKDENSILRDKITQLGSSEESVSAAEGVQLPDLPEDGVLYVDGDPRRLNAVSLRHPNWACEEPTYNFNVSPSNIKLIIVQRYRLKHKHTQMITKQFPNAIMYVVDKADFENEIKTKLYG